MYAKKDSTVGSTDMGTRIIHIDNRYRCLWVDASMNDKKRLPIDLYNGLYNDKIYAKSKE